MTENEDKTIYITVIGDSGVGKTSLIASAATETFPIKPPPVLPPTRLPAEATVEGVPVVITDTSSRPEDRQALELACKTATVIILCFSMDNKSSVRRMSSFWLPELGRMGAKVPILLVGCKSDQRTSDPTITNAILRTVQEFKNVDTCMECSSKKLEYVGDVFWYALKSVLYPLSPLYDSESGRIQPKTARALKCIFSMYDQDKDGLLSDAELSAFQNYCFGVPLQQDELESVKQVVANRMPEGVSNDGLTLSGFMYLNLLFIERGRLETTWTVLRKHGYSNELEFNESVSKAARFPIKSPDQIVELTEEARAFLLDVFKRSDVDEDDVLSAKERDNVFSPAPRDPWKNAEEYRNVLVETSRRGLLTIRGYMSLWVCMAAFDPPNAYVNALYLGFPRNAPIDKLFKLSRRRHSERKISDLARRRKTVRGTVFGSSNVDVGSILEGLITQSRPSHGQHVDDHVTIAVAEVSGVLQSEAEKEITPASPPPSPSSIGANDSYYLMLQKAETGGACSPETDVGVFAFNASDIESFRSTVAEMLQVAEASNDSLPCVLLGVLHPGDVEMSEEFMMEVRETCRRLWMQPPLVFPSSLTPHISNEEARGMVEIYRAIVAAAVIDTEAAIPQTPTLKARRRYKRLIRKTVLLAAGGTCAGLVSYVLYRTYNHYRKQQTTTSV